MSNTVHLSLKAGFKVHENGTFGFKTSLYTQGHKWVIFIRSEKLYLIWFSKLKLQAAQL